MRTICNNCGQYFETSDPHNEFCSKECRKQYIERITSTRFTNITVTLNLRNELRELQTQIKKKSNKHYAYWRIIEACIKEIIKEITSRDKRYWNKEDIVDVLRKWL